MKMKLTVVCFIVAVCIKVSVSSYNENTKLLKEALSRAGTYDSPTVELQIVALWLAAHKYFDVDRRKGNDLRWKFDERVYSKHFPVPHLKRLHPAVKQACDRNLQTCINEVKQKALVSYSLSVYKYGEWYRERINQTSLPFSTDLELFQYRTTATYYFCWFTMKRDKRLQNFMNYQNCLKDLDKVREKEWANIDVVDFRSDSSDQPYLCAEILFCPDPCYGHETEGSVLNVGALYNDAGNPCRGLKDRTCKWDHRRNIDFESLIRNRFNITCNCARDKQGFEWNSRFDLCVDIDECQDSHTKCSKGRECQNTAGSYECLCPLGYRFDEDLDKCVVQIPLPAHSLTRSGKVKARKQQSALMRLVEYLLGLRKTTRRRR